MRLRRRDPGDAPYWWRGRTPDETPVWTPDTAVFSGPVDHVPLEDVPFDRRSGLRHVRFDQAAGRHFQLSLDEIGLTTLWSSFEGCTFTERSRRLNKEGVAPQGSFGHRPSLYRLCRFVGVRFRSLGGFAAGEARFEGCVFERCRFETFFPTDADFLRCRFVGPIRSAAFSGIGKSGRPNEIVDNDFAEAVFSDNVAWRRNFPVDLQKWPEGFVPIVDK